MGISKNETLPNGVPLQYFRIVSLTCVVNNQSIIEVAGYVSQDAREQEQQADPETGCDVYIDTRFISVDYDPDMSVNKAYELLKSMPEYEGATDVIDEWAAGLSYYPGDLCMYQENEYRCIQAHASQAGWEPPNVPALWAKEQDPSDIPEWVQPTGAHDAYALNDKVRHNGKVWESEYDNNIWEPGVYGWHEEGDE